MEKEKVPTSPPSSAKVQSILHRSLPPAGGRWGGGVGSLRVADCVATS